MSRVRAAAWAGTSILAVTGLLAGCTDPIAPDPSPSPSPTPTGPVDLTFGVYGARAEVAAYSQVVEAFNSTHPYADVTLNSVINRDSQRALLETGQVPDVFLVSRRDLGVLLRDELNQPVDELLDERGVDFGDGFQRDALLAFAADDGLQCVPLGISPMVLYLNTDLVDFDAMAARGRDVPEPSDAATGEGEETEPGHDAWTWDEFTAAVDFATRPRQGTRGLHVDHTLRALAPFLYAAGGRLFDEEAEPTSLALSEEDSRAALQQVLPLLRNPHVNLTTAQLEQKPALTWFKSGELGMLPGFRSLVPELRAVPGLDFDVIAMPTVDEARTVGDVTGLCLSARASDPAAAADFLVHATGSASVRTLTEAGYLVPAIVEVAESESFLQPGQQPEHAEVFNSSVKNIVLSPPLDDFEDLESAVADALQRLFMFGALDLEAVTTDIDEASRPVLAPTP